MHLFHRAHLWLCMWNVYRWVCDCECKSRRSVCRSQCDVGFVIFQILLQNWEGKKTQAENQFLIEYRFLFHRCTSVVFTETTELIGFHHWHWLRSNDIFDAWGSMPLGMCLVCHCHSIGMHLEFHSGKNKTDGNDQKGSPSNAKSWNNFDFTRLSLINCCRHWMSKQNQCIFFGLCCNVLWPINLIYFF